MAEERTVTRSKSEWTRVTFGDVARLSRERSTDPEADGYARYIGLEHMDPGDLQVRRWGDIEDGVTFTNVFRPGQVLFGKRRAYLRKVAVADFEGICSGDIYVLEANGGTLLPELLPFICQTDAFFEHAIGTSAGSLSPRTNWESLASFEFLLPPLVQQRQIVEVMSAAWRVIETSIRLTRELRTANLAALDQMFQSALVDSAEAGSSLGDLFEHVVDKGHAELPVLSVTIDGEIVRRESLERAVSDETGEAKLLRVQPGDLAYNTMRLWQGAIGVASEEGLISPAYTVLRARSAAWSPEYYCAMLRSPALQRRYRTLVTGVASDRWRLYYRDLCKIRVRRLSDYQISESLAVLQRSKQAEAQSDARLLAARSVLRELQREVFAP